MKSNAVHRGRKVRVSLCQILCIGGDREGNFRRIEYALEASRSEGAEIACFPESCVLGWENPEAHFMAHPIPGADAERVQMLAQKYGMMVAIGMDEKSGDRLYDSAILVDSCGKLLLKHRKINVLPELMDPPYSQGRAEDIAAVDTEFGRIGMLICADTFTDEHLYKAASFGPNLLIVPYGWAAEHSEWPGHSDELHKLVCRVARTVGCPVVGCNLVGQMTHGPWAGRSFGGSSVVADADGRILAVAKDRDVDVMVVEIPLERSA
ncbi:MAG: carbon-nitrogen hydrolase family protein [Armatimonadota bacterium]